VHRVDRVFVALEPVARHVGKHDLHEAIRAGERLVVRHERFLVRWAHIRPQHPCLFLDGIGLDLHAILELRIRVRDLFEGLVQAGAVFAPQPAVVIAAQAALFHPAVAEIGPPMWTVAIDQPVMSGMILVQDEVLAHESDRFQGDLVELRGCADRRPVATQQVAHQRPWPDAEECLVLFLAEHAVPATISINCSGRGVTEGSGESARA
jgi:hypothetical protein